jgi:hypothetical protein
MERRGKGLARRTSSVLAVGREFCVSILGARSSLYSTEVALVPLSLGRRFLMLNSALIVSIASLSVQHCPNK